ncbi:MAG TPA: 4Fe-4S double cluster binding domain-containing protein [Methanocellaceae archaeon]
MHLDESLEKFAVAHGADFYGVADLARAKEAIADQGGPDIAMYPRAISIGIRLMDPIVDQLPQRSKRAVSVSYKTHCYDVINGRLDLIISELSSLIQREGYKAYPVPASERMDDERICAIFSHKMAAHLAGLGWIGKSCLLVTPEWGPRARWATILTDAPLKAGKPMEQRCGTCMECTNICPQHAFTGRYFDESEPRESRYDALKCQEYLRSLEKTTDYGVCGMCLYICPHGRHKLH